MRPIVPSEPQESETPGIGGQRDEKSPGTGIQELTFLMRCPELDLRKDCFCDLKSKNSSRSGTGDHDDTCSVCKGLRSFD